MAFPSKKNPVGPSLRNLQSHSWSLSGAHFKLNALKHNHDRVDESVRGGQLNIFDLSEFGRFHSAESGEPLSAYLLYSHWRYYGFPFIHGLLGDIQFAVEVLHLPEFDNLFNPSHLECAIERFLYSAGDHAIVRRSGATRLNWDVTTLNGIEWVNYGYDGATWLHSAEEVAGRIWQTPITSEHLLTIVFRGVIRKSDTELKREFNNVENLIMQSAELELSEDALRDKKEVQENAESLVSLKGLQPYTFDDFYSMERLDIVRAIDAKYNYEKSYEEILPEIEQEIKDQKRKEKEITEKILKSHLRFKKE